MPRGDDPLERPPPSLSSEMPWSAPRCPEDWRSLPLHLSMRLACRKIRGFPSVRVPSSPSETRHRLPRDNAPLPICPSSAACRRPPHFLLDCLQGICSYMYARLGVRRRAAGWAKGGCRCAVAPPPSDARHEKGTGTHVLHSKRRTAALHPLGLDARRFSLACAIRDTPPTATKRNDPTASIPLPFPPALPLPSPHQW